MYPCSSVTYVPVLHPAVCVCVNVNVNVDVVVVVDVHVGVNVEVSVDVCVSDRKQTERRRDGKLAPALAPSWKHTGGSPG